MERLENLSISIKERVVATAITIVVGNILRDLGMMSRKDLFKFNIKLVRSKISELNEHMEALTPNERQEFVNQRLEKIKNSERRRLARTFIQTNFRDYLNKKYQ